MYLLFELISEYSILNPIEGRSLRFSVYHFFSFFFFCYLLSSCDLRALKIFLFNLLSSTLVIILSPFKGSEDLTSLIVNSYSRLIFVKVRIFLDFLRFYKSKDTRERVL